MLAFAPDYENLTLIAKVEVFEHALKETEGDDLAKLSTKSIFKINNKIVTSRILIVNGGFQVLWLKSRTSEVWLSRRTNYTRSLAVMSMVIQS